MYLTPQLKLKYNDHFQHLLEYTKRGGADKSEKLNHEIEKYLIGINKSENIGLLYSDSVPSGESYLEFCYSQIIEHDLRDIDQEIDKCIRSRSDQFEQDENHSVLLSMNEPKNNPMFTPDHPSQLGFRTDINYWQIKHIRVTLRSTEFKKHEYFFEILADKLSSIGRIKR